MKLLFIILCILGSSLYGADSPKTLLKQLEESFSKIEDFQAHFEQIEYNHILERKKKSSGIIYSLPSGKLFWFTQEPESFKVISNGKKIWLYNPKTKDQQVEIWEQLDPQTKIALLFLRREGKFDTHFTSRWHSKAKKIIELMPKKKISVKKILIHLNPKGFNDKIFFTKLVFFFPLERETELTLSDLQFNQNLL